MCLADRAVQLGFLLAITATSVGFGTYEAIPFAVGMIGLPQREPLDETLLAQPGEPCGVATLRRHSVTSGALIFHRPTSTANAYKIPAPWRRRH
jgi:hypothetical protein